MASNKIRKLYKFTGTDPRFVYLKSYDRWDIAAISGQSIHSIKNRIVGTDCFGDDEIKFLKRPYNRPAQSLTWIEMYSAFWLKERLV